MAGFGSGVRSEDINRPKLLGLSVSHFDPKRKLRYAVC